MTNEPNPDIPNVLQETMAQDGLNLFTIEAADRFDAELTRQLERAAHRAGLDTAEKRLFIVIVGNRGGEFWRRLPPAARTRDNPVDDFSAANVTRAFQRVAGDDSWALLYPGDCGFSLLRLGAACGWGRPSWLGINVHADFGTWFAFRAVVATTLPLGRRVLDPGADVCSACLTRDCVRACPVDAPGPAGRFDSDACLDQRLQPGSGCASRCLARESCPAGTADRYPDDLIEYFYGRSLRAVRMWRDGADAPRE